MKLQLIPREKHIEYCRIVDNLLCIHTMFKTSQWTSRSAMMEILAVQDGYTTYENMVGKEWNETFG
jgi:hypothetical protein